MLVLIRFTGLTYYIFTRFLVVTRFFQVFSGLYRSSTGSLVKTINNRLAHFNMINLGDYLVSTKRGLTVTKIRLTRFFSGRLAELQSKQSCSRKAEILTLLSYSGLLWSFVVLLVFDQFLISGESICQQLVESVAEWQSCRASRVADKQKT